MKRYDLDTLVTFTLQTIPTLKNELPRLILNEAAQLTELHQMYCDCILDLRGNDGERVAYQRNLKEIIDQYYMIVRICFMIVLDSGDQERVLYFKQYKPSRMVRKPQDLKEWLDGVVGLLENSDLQLLQPYREKLKQLQGSLTEVLDRRRSVQVKRTQIIRARREQEKILKKQYQVFKHYFTGWCLKNDRDERIYFKEMRLTPKRKRSGVAVLLLDEGERGEV